MNKVYCPVCDKMTEYEVQQLNEKHKVQGEEFTQLDNVVVCTVCGEKIFHEDYDQDNIERVYKKFCDKFNIVYKSELIDILNKYSVISQDSIAQILGIDSHTLTQYILGMIPSRVHSNLFKLIKDRQNFLQLVKGRVDLDKEEVLSLKNAYKPRKTLKNRIIFKKHLRLLYRRQYNEE